VNLLLGPAGDRNHAASRVRIHQHLPGLAEHGVRATLVPAPRLSGHGPRAAVRLRASQLAQVARLARMAPAHDVTLVQRMLLPAPLRRLLARRARALVFDCDDAIYLDPDGGRPGSRWLASRARRWTAMLAAVGTATVSTPALEARARRHQPRTVVIESPVDTDRFRPDAGARGPGVVVGWIGSHATSGYLWPVLPVLRRLAAREPAVRIELIGADRRLEGDGVRVREWSWETEVRALQAFDVGIMPQPDDEWARAKAGYKVLQYMACGVPAVASPVGAGLALVRPGETGWLASDAAAWEHALTELVGNPAARARMGRAARERVEVEHALRVWTPRLHAVLVVAASR
jgi:glycosyltransferase involved in cell wall biosynthesis